MEALLANPFAQHPAFTDGSSETWTSLTDSKPPWTLDMDDMLRTAVRRHAFEFGAAAQQLQGYIVKLRACGGILPEDVVAPLYTADVCRRRWAALDYLACKAFRERVGGGGSARAAAAAAAKGGAARPSAPVRPTQSGSPESPSASLPAGATSGDDSDGDDDDYGIVDLNALRAQRLGGILGAPPAPAPKPAPRRTQPKAPSPQPSTTASSAVTTRARGSAAASATASAAAAPPPQETLSDGTPIELLPKQPRSRQLAELENMAAALTASVGTVAAGEASDGGAANPQHQQAASTLLHPLGALQPDPRPRRRPRPHSPSPSASLSPTPQPSPSLTPSPSSRSAAYVYGGLGGDALTLTLTQTLNLNQVSYVSAWRAWRRCSRTRLPTWQPSSARWRR